MSDDWKVGDLALCLKPDRWKSLSRGGFAHVGFGPQPECIYAVERLHVGANGSLSLMFEEWPNKSFNARHFRKIRPDAHEPCEEEFVTLLRRKRVPEKVS